MNLDLLHGGDSDLVRKAGQSFGYLLYALAISLVFLVPFDAPLGLFVALITLSLGGLAASVRGMARARRQGKALKVLLGEAALSLMVYAVLAVVAIRLLAGDTASLYALVVVIAAMLVRPSQNAWQFLLQARAGQAETKRRKS